MIAFRLIIVASALASASIVGADSLAATRIEGAREAKAFAEQRPQVAGGGSHAVQAAAAAKPARLDGQAPAPRTCPERSWPYGAARCVAGLADGVRVIALDVPSATLVTRKSL